MLKPHREISSFVFLQQLVAQSLRRYICYPRSGFVIGGPGSLIALGPNCMLLHLAQILITKINIASFMLDIIPSVNIGLHASLLRMWMASQSYFSQRMKPMLYAC